MSSDVQPGDCRKSGAVPTKPGLGMRVRRRMNCQVPGHGNRCIAVWERGNNGSYPRTTENRIALRLEMEANGLSTLWPGIRPNLHTMDMPALPHEKHLLRRGAE